MATATTRTSATMFGCVTDVEVNNVGDGRGGCTLSAGKHISRQTAAHYIAFDVI